MRRDLFTDDGVSAVSRTTFQLSVLGEEEEEEEDKIVAMKSPDCAF